MNKQRELLDKILNPRLTVQVWEATVKAVQESTCTVALLATDLVVEDVRLVVDYGESKNCFLLKPMVGSLVLVGCIQNEIADLFVLQYTEIETFEFKRKKTLIKADESGVYLANDRTEVVVLKDSATVRQGGAEVVLSGEKVSVKNDGANLKDLLGDLVTLLNSFVVLTAQGPSAGLGPNSITDLAALNLKINQLLQ